MSVKIEVVRESVDHERFPRPWSVRDGVRGEFWAEDSNGHFVTSSVSKEQAQAIVEAVNNLPEPKGKIEKFVVEMDPETFRRITAVLASVAALRSAASGSAHEFWDQASPFIDVDPSLYVPSSDDVGLIEFGTAAFKLKEDA